MSWRSHLFQCTGGPAILCRTALLFAACLLLSAEARAQTITITISSDPAGPSLSGSGTKNTGLTLGTVSRSGGSLPPGVTRTTAASSWSLSTPFLVHVTKDMVLVSPSYSLQAQLATTDPSRTWKVDSATLNASAATTVSVSEPYDTDRQHTLSLQIPDGSAAESFGNTISLLVVSN